MANNRGVVVDEATHSLSTFGVSVSNDHRLCHLASALADAAVFVQKLFFLEKWGSSFDHRPLQNDSRARDLSHHDDDTAVTQELSTNSFGAQRAKGKGALQSVSCIALRRSRIESTIDECVWRAVRISRDPVFHGALEI